MAEDRMAGVSDAGDLLLASGRTVVVADLRWAGPEPGPPMLDAASAKPGPIAWLRSLRDQRVTVRPTGEPDRWNRLTGSVALLNGGSTPIDLAELAIAEGLALVDVGERDELCRPDLLKLELSARVAGRGVWTTPPVRAGDLEALAGRAGRFAVIEGRIVSVGERANRTYLNFGRDFAKDFAIVVPKRSWAAFKAAGRDATALRGRLVRVRGTIEVRRAPSLEITAPDMLEILPEGAGLR
jgi:hypothetical protein